MGPPFFQFPWRAHIRSQPLVKRGVRCDRPAVRRSLVCSRYLRLHISVAGDDGGDDGDDYGGDNHGGDGDGDDGGDDGGADVGGDDVGGDDGGNVDDCDDWRL